MSPTQSPLKWEHATPREMSFWKDAHIKCGHPHCEEPPQYKLTCYHTIPTPEPEQRFCETHCEEHLRELHDGVELLPDNRPHSIQSPKPIQLSFKASENRDAAVAAVSDLDGSLQGLGADVSILLQESSEFPPLVLYVGMPSMLLARAIAKMLMAWINRNRVTIKSTKIDGTEVSIEGSEDFVRDLLIRKSQD